MKQQLQVRRKTIIITVVVIIVVAIVSIVATNRILNGTHSVLLVKNDNNDNTIQTKTINMTIANNTLVQTKDFLQTTNKNKSLRLSSLTKHRHLEFIHIPQPVGVDIEAAANRNGIQWGICHFANSQMSYQKSMGGVICRPTQTENNETLVYQNYNDSREAFIPYWYWPQQFFKNHTTLLNPYINADTFVVISNPYERMIRLYLHVVRHVTSTIRREILTKEHLNHWVQVKLRLLQKNPIVVVNQQERENWYSAFFLPQREYVFDGQKMIVHHVLRTETLEHDFPNLMKQYGLEQIQLPNATLASLVTNHTDFTLDDLDALTLRMVEHTYADDFDAFGYHRLHRNTTPTEPTLLTQHHHPQLEFVHIPKTGGTIIESTAALAGIRWSICHIAPPSVVQRISDHITQCPGLAPWADLYGSPIHGCPLWHLPPHYFQLPRFPHNPYNNAKLFAVVRNPFDRLVSEYFYSAQYSSTQNITTSVSHFNAWVRFFLSRTKEATKGDIANNITGDHKYFLNAGHFIPQYDFVFHGDQQVIHHVLKFEQLHDDFHDLMALYHLNLTLPSKQDNHVRKATKTLGVKDLTPDLILMIEEVYANDFREFGYALFSSANKTQ